VGVKLTEQETILFREILDEVWKNTRVEESARYIQHGHTSVFRHSVSVAYVSFWLARRLHIETDEHALIRGALLHDYFLYDWHEPDDSHKWHGFFHAGKAWRNALRDIPDLSPKEENMIRRHMFPLNPIPPTCREAWILCLADKICSTQETVEGFCTHVKQNREETPTSFR
jgi:uncharacterized protein